MNQHYDEYEWVRYLKGLDADRSAAMLRHAERCPTCTARLAFCREVAEFVQSESSEPPAEWIQEALSGFHPAEQTEPQTFFAGLVSDTFLESPAGVRAVNLNERRMVFDSERFRIEVSADFSGRQLQSVVGHLESKLPHEAAEIVVPVELVLGETVLKTFSNKNGEFYFPLEGELSGDPLELRIRLDGGTCLVALVPF